MSEPQEIRVPVNGAPLELVLRLSITVEQQSAQTTSQEPASVEPLRQPPTKSQIVADEFFRRLAAGQPVAGLNITQLAKDIFNDESSRPTVSRTWNECLRGEFPDPNPEGRFHSWSLRAS